MRLRRTTHISKAALCAALIGPLALLAGPVAAATGPAAALAGLDFAPHAAGARLHPGAAHNLKFATSTNWAGYAAHSTTYTSVTSTWREPGASCGSSTSYASFWTGLDGYASSSVEQTGTLVECYHGAAYQYAWYEMYPASPVYFNNTVAAGDTMVSKVTASSSGAFTLYLADTTRGWSHTVNQSNSSLARSSAEVIAEAPSSSSGVLPLANFGTVTFTSSYVNGGTLGASNPTAITMVTSSGATKVSVGSISGGTSFSATWHHS
ncbi:hypothetical protein KGA66_16555 [Actinocrinis puniceicyclus]|uniref:Peptidase A4 family protein n=1 Tax=Actinocrinis puniceicyclus TaxID=977794 RepID=A0A8J7WPX7_9ACTN|nr:G1 family glutamic endopeptidase [Actinocrinis puniceicyclus]MBS2964670.1 hypothetical protein [Actinocrinis puniceicyclus]